MFPAYTAEQEQALSLLRVRSVFGNRIYSGSGAAPLLGIQGRATTGGEMAAAGRSRAAGSGVFPSPIAHAARLETTASAVVGGKGTAAEDALRLCSRYPFVVFDGYFCLLVLKSGAREVYNVDALRKMIYRFLPFDGFMNLWAAVARSRR